MAPRHGQPLGSVGTGLPREVEPGRQAWAGLAPCSQRVHALSHLVTLSGPRSPRKGDPRERAQ